VFYVTKWEGKGINSSCLVFARSAQKAHGCRAPKAQGQAETNQAIQEA